MFEDIKVGDTVFIEKIVKFGWSNRRYFTIPVNVTRVTKTQFTVSSGERFKKDGGRQIGKGIYSLGKKEGVDQTSEMKEFELKLKIGQLSRDSATEISTLCNNPEYLNVNIKTIIDIEKSLSELLMKVFYANNNI